VLDRRGTDSGLRRNREAQYHQCDKPNGFRQACEFLRVTAGSQTEPVQQSEQRESGDSYQLHVSDEVGKQASGKVSQGHSHVGVAHALHRPIAASHNESDVLSKGAARIYIPTARSRKHGAEFRDGTAAEKRVNSAQNPDDKEKRGTVQIACDLAGCPKDPGPDGISDANRNAKTETKNAQQMSRFAVLLICYGVDINPP
jgi:hypothetical protein